MHYGCTVNTYISSFCDISSLLFPYPFHSVQAVSLSTTLVFLIFIIMAHDTTSLDMSVIAYAVLWHS
jgi:hypothetical protein